ncbi:hypothetical protein ABB37_05834 [Leptomonas pyrrhocoris]|uniref:Uncharacterized protein n=1 Tax=Leptomonas pyrrhocoris TaxID=157538 RepID=A0A0M9FYS6_LEPPY|nr:hypothetical protein ABB37_05826 [Leptomonas pyrrhocoris]XP_015657138.1 hypothetical protein ABB37_05834 [Leptomonas pyrrhocoris]KPA78689.1 hypothetical protein ABB37_05826 [Leptomonas pyrrhocoris]KPA78699.1 hypothetical protein ABB37_05834 [Leptomonas pyrrhocoris]|eukprot:XP_015657128.1 hypothetical protein ABB37_05826 [Leptomonas pyrrhocoris]
MFLLAFLGQLFAPPRTVLFFCVVLIFPISLHVVNDGSAMMRCVEHTFFLFCTAQCECLHRATSGRALECCRASQTTRSFLPCLPSPRYSARRRRATANGFLTSPFISERFLFCVVRAMEPSAF